MQELRSWIGDERYDPAKGIPAEKAIQICEKVKEWAAHLGGMEEDPLLLAAAGISEDARLSIEASGMALITKPQLDRILDTVIGEGLEDPNSFSEAAPWSHVSTPGQIWGPAETVFWWNCTGSSSGHTGAPWTESERRSLVESGVALQSHAQNRLRESASWHRAVEFTGERLILSYQGQLQGNRPYPIRFLTRSNRNSKPAEG